MAMAAALLFLLFSLGMVKAKTRHQTVAVLLAGTIGAVLVAPRPVRAQGSLVGAIQAVLSVINGAIHGALASIANARNTMSAFYAQALWPVTLIHQAQGLATQMIAQYRNPMHNIFNLHLASATLPATQALEQTVRDVQTNDFSALTTNYKNVYGSVPASSSASPYDRNMADMDDALAEDTLKTLKESDEADNMTLGVANQVESAATQAAPGSAPFLTATAVVGTIQSQAVMQKMLAAELRQEAGLLAHRTALDKEGASSAQSVASALMNILR
jgi:hypothetical protein